MMHYSFRRIYERGESERGEYWVYTLRGSEKRLPSGSRFRSSSALLAHLGLVLGSSWRSSWPQHGPTCHNLVPTWPNLAQLGPNLAQLRSNLRGRTLQKPSKTVVFFNVFQVFNIFDVFFTHVQWCYVFLSLCCLLVFDWCSPCLTGWRCSIDLIDRFDSFSLLDLIRTPYGDKVA